MSASGMKRDATHTLSLRPLLNPCGHNAPDRPGASTQLLFVQIVLFQEF
jgi:hypothetical protein